MTFQFIPLTAPSSFHLSFFVAAVLPPGDAPDLPLFSGHLVLAIQLSALMSLFHGGYLRSVGSGVIYLLFLHCNFQNLLFIVILRVLSLCPSFSFFLKATHLLSYNSSQIWVSLGYNQGIGKAVLPSGGSRGESASWSFQLLETALYPLAHGPFLHLHGHLKNISFLVTSPSDHSPGKVLQV